MMMDHQVIRTFSFSSPLLFCVSAREGKKESCVVCKQCNFFTFWIFFVSQSSMLVCPSSETKMCLY
jgi:hypothetical protein